MSKDSKHDKHKTRRRDAVNAVRLSWLGHDVDKIAPTFKVMPADVKAARKLLKAWPPYGEPDTTVEQQVEYLLSTGWTPKKRK